MAKKSKPVIGKAKADPKVQGHWDGWNAALDDALQNTGWKAGDHKNVAVEFYANVNVVNPGSIVEYIVKLTPGT
jgi:hypothetical protein